MATSIFSVISAISGTLISANGIALACGNAKISVHISQSL